MRKGHGAAPSPGGAGEGGGVSPSPGASSCPLRPGATVVRFSVKLSEPGWLGAAALPSPAAVREHLLPPAAARARGGGGATWCPR